MGAGLPYTTGLRCISRHLKHLSATETPRTEDRCLVLLFRFDNPHCAHMYAAIPPLVAQCGEAVRMADLPQGTLARIRTYLPVAKVSALLLKASFNGFEDLWKLAPVTDPSPKPWMLALQDKDERSRDEPTSGEKMDIDSSPEQKKSCAELPELTPERMAKPFAAPMKIKSLVTTMPVKKRGNRGQGKVKGKPTRKGPETLQPTVAGKKRSAPPSQAVPSGRGKARST
ncbi:hypothetical protein IWQ62_006368 [Dispira parvispora]|uniref:Uncharacterized protein n=1 Tax=Dispira parvispora TaxID=1520584 RepID=A0A9W8AN61_9FUNG|nr:hypothetical protein IWQ62_006368 [Dispira parvispora]